MEIKSSICIAQHRERPQEDPSLSEARRRPPRVTQAVTVMSGRALAPVAPAERDAGIVDDRGRRRAAGSGATAKVTV